MNSNAKWFAIGALTCAGCFVLGGTGTQPENPKRLVLDELIVNKTIYVGDTGSGMWIIQSDGKTARLLGLDGNETSKHEIMVSAVGTMTTAAVMGNSKPDEAPEFMVTTSVVAPAYVSDMLPAVSFSMGNASRVIRMMNKRAESVVWESIELP